MRLIFQVEDLEAEQERLIGPGSGPRAPRRQPGEGYREVRLHDPEGTPIRLFCRIPSKTTPEAAARAATIGLLEALMRLALSRTIVIALAVVAYAVPGPVLAQDPPKFENVSSAPPRTPEEERKGFHLPPGFEIQLVAAEPDIHKPINIAFDDRGRLWVTESVEYPFPPPRGRRPRDAVKDPRRLRPRRPGAEGHASSPTA